MSLINFMEDVQGVSQMVYILLFEKKQGFYKWTSQIQKARDVRSVGLAIQIGNKKSMISLRACMQVISFQPLRRQQREMAYSTSLLSSVWN